jgi:hypothetical protein
LTEFHSFIKGLVHRQLNPFAHPFSDLVDVCSVQ